MRKIAQFIAEIIEYPHFLMVRDNPASDWPMPGALGFGVDPWLFEASLRPIEIRASGYEFHSRWAGAIGCLFFQPGEIEKLRQIIALLGDVNRNEEAESFNTWLARYPHLRDFEALSTLLYSIWAEDAPDPELFVYDDVVDTAGTGSQIGALIYESSVLILNDVSRARALDYVARYLDAIGLSECKTRAGILSHTFWRGTGAPRLINAFGVA